MSSQVAVLWCRIVPRTSSRLLTTAACFARVRRLTSTAAPTSSGAISSKAINGIQDALKYKFSSPELLREATLVAGVSASVSDNTAHVEGNKRIAQVGDALLRVCLVEKLYKNGATTGETAILHDIVASNKNLERVAVKNHLDWFLVANPSQQGKLSRVTAATAVEALIGAVWLDSRQDWGKVQEVIETLQVVEHGKSMAIGLISNLLDSEKQGGDQSKTAGSHSEP